MLKKLLAGFMVMAFALTGAPIIASADIQVGDNLKLFGDFRMRLEVDTRDPDTDGSDVDTIANDGTRERPRYRARFGAKYQSPVEWLSIGMRMSTGDGSTTSFNSPHVTMAAGSTGSSGNLDVIDLDRAYAVVKFLESGALIVGKQAYPLWQQTEQFWDSDISPEGFAVAYTAGLNEMGSVTVAGAYYYVANNSWQGSIFENDALGAWQVAWHGKVNGISPTLAFTGMHQIDGDNDADSHAVNAVGTNISGLKTSSDVSFYMASMQLKGKSNDVALSVGADIHFSNADIVTAGTSHTNLSDDNDFGFVVNVRAKQGPYGIRYYYYDVEENAAPSYGGTALSQDNLPATGMVPTGFDGHRIQFDYKLAKNVSTDFRIYLYSADTDNIWGSNAGSTTKADRNRYQLNFNVKF